MIQLCLEGCMCDPVTVSIIVVSGRLTFNCTKDNPIVLKKGTTVARMVAANEVPEMVVAEGTVGALQTH